MAAQGPPGRGAMHATLRVERGGWSLRRLQKPCQTAIGIPPRLNVPGSTVADIVTAAFVDAAASSRFGRNAHGPPPCLLAR